METPPPVAPQGGPVTQLINCRLLRDGELVRDDLYVQDGVIIDPRPRFYQHKRGADHRVDLGGLLVAPGYIDVQINGAFGLDFARCAPDELPHALETVAHGLLQHGVTSFLPTIMSTTPDTYRHLLTAVQPTMGTAHAGAEVLGVHLEGPFLSPKATGCHNAALVRGFEPARNSVFDVYGPFLDSVRMVTLAPELPGALDVITRLSRAGIVVAAGTAQVTVGGHGRVHAKHVCVYVSICVGGWVDGYRALGGNGGRGRGCGAGGSADGDPPVQRHDAGTVPPVGAHLPARTRHMRVPPCPCSAPAHRMPRVTGGGADYTHSRIHRRIHPHPACADSVCAC
jgi:hypothetical protein